ncbi:MAG: hypothetical protein JOY92_09525 [Verrucomicrobia bacterium]|nr:hypothetical protein [Verrucomicrobiota bacterium]
MEIKDWADEIDRRTSVGPPFSGELLQDFPYATLRLTFTQLASGCVGVDRLIVTGR